MRALVIEDDPNFALLITRFLPDVICMIAENAERADWLLKSREWDLVWTDLMLPDSHPKDTIAMVRAHCKNAAVLVCSGAVDNLDEFQADFAVRKDEVMTRDSMQAAVDTAIANRRKKDPYEKSVESVEALAKIDKP